MNIERSIANCMGAHITAWALAILFGAPSPADAQRSLRFEPQATSASPWRKGNTHAHTLESDGDSPPAVVAAWYKNHGYNFLVLSDHNVRVDPAKLNHLMDSTFLLIPGEELTSAFQRKAVHVNGLNIPGVLMPRTDTTLLGTIQKNVDAIRGVSGVPHINHPNFGWALTPEVLARVRGDRLIEIFNGHPLVHNNGGGGAMGMEAAWDYILTSGKRIYGIATDDAHHFTGEFAANRANPGRGWVAVRSPRLDAKTILTEMEAGRFYASNGVELDSVIVAGPRLEVHIRAQGDFRFTTEFIGRGGQVLRRTTSNPARYQLSGGESYVRARVTDSGGSHAWVQPVFVERRQGPR